MLIIVGICFLLARWTDSTGVLQWLPLLLVYLWGRDLLDPAAGRKPTILPLFLAVWLLINTTGFLGAGFLTSWPALMALAGIGLIIDSVLWGEPDGGHLPQGE